MVKIGALTSVIAKQPSEYRPEPANDSEPTKVIRLETLLSALKVHKYDYATFRLTNKCNAGGLSGYEELSHRSIRIMNRFSRLMAQYHEANRHKLKCSYGKVIFAMFHDEIEEYGDKSVIPANQFYAKLKVLKVRRTAADEPNLTRFLACEED